MAFLQALPGLQKTTTSQVGNVVWAKVHHKGKCWPGVVIDGAEWGQEISSPQKVWVYWYGDHRFTEVRKIHIFDFKDEFPRFFRKSVGKGYDLGVLEALKECGKRMGKIKGGLTRDVLLSWAYSGFPEDSEIFEESVERKVLLNGVIPSDVRQQLEKFRPTTEDDSDSESVSSLEHTAEEEIDNSQKLAMVKAIEQNEIQLTDVCLACLTVKDDLEVHPLFNAFICSNCLAEFKRLIYAVGTDGNNYNCAVCLSVEPTLIYMCSQPDCFRSFCRNCIQIIFPVSVRDIKRLEDWHCFMCTSYSQETHGFVQPLYNHWRLNIWELFHKCDLEVSALRSTPVRVLFTGGNSCSVRLTIQRLSEVKIEVSTILISGFFDKDVETLSQEFPQKLEIAAAPWELDEISLLKYFPIDIVVGGSRDLYSTDPGDHKSMNAVCIFDDFQRILSNVQMHTLVSPVFWMFEFEEPICAEFYGIISRFLEFEPGKWRPTSDKISASILVWTNVNALWTQLIADGLPQVKI